MFYGERLWDGVTQIHLAVSDVAESAKYLYERNGFVAWGREPRALCWQGQCVDETHMVFTPRPTAAPKFHTTIQKSD
jgi:hypothetical protein